jgi:hypothetical protein
MKSITVFLAAALLALAVSVPTVLARGGDGIRIALKPSAAFPAANGSARFKATGERELQVEVEHVRRLAGTRVAFVVAGKKIGTARVSGLGSAEFTRRGAAVPAVKAGTAVSVKTAAGKLIVRGSF